MCTAGYTAGQGTRRANHPHVWVCARLGNSADAQPYQPRQRYTSEGSVVSAEGL